MEFGMSHRIKPKRERESKRYIVKLSNSNVRACVYTCVREHT